MTYQDKLNVAAHLFTRLRLKAGRTIDAVWMAANAEYAHEVLRLARSYDDDELKRLADRYENLGEGAAAPLARPLAGGREPPGVATRYVGKLR